MNPIHRAALQAAVDALEKQPAGRRSRCFYCLAPATLLCDGILGWRRVWHQQPEGAARFQGTAEGWWCIDTSQGGDEMVTCDRPLCEDCAHRAGVTFMCGTGPAAGMETTDHCRDCAENAGKSAPLLSDEELDALQRRRAIRPSGRYDSLRELAAPLRDLLETTDADGDV